MRAMLFLACNLLSNVLALCEETQVVQHVQSFDVANMWVAVGVGEQCLGISH